MLPVYSYDQIAHQLTDVGQVYFGDTRQNFNVRTGDTISYDMSALDDAGRVFARTALDIWTLYSGIRFAPTTSKADLVFNHGTSSRDAFALVRATSSGEITSAKISISREWVQRDWSYENNKVVIEYSSYSMQTYIHEIGHALGLAHAGNYNSSASYPKNAGYANDSWQASIMSYFDQKENTYVDASFAYPVTPMIADILAIQDLYGRPNPSSSGDTIYGQNGNTGTYLDDFSSLSTAFALTIFDAGGRDTIDVSDDTHDQWITLEQEGISDILGLHGNMIIARYTNIENLFAGSGNDEIYGNKNSNMIVGNAGNDTVFGAAGNDVLTDGLGNNHLNGDGGSDVISTFSGLNMLSGGIGNDFLMGGVQNDTIKVDAGNDILIGDAGIGVMGGSCVLMGGAGNDTLMGGRGADIFVFRPNEGSDRIATVQTPDVTVVEADQFEIARFDRDFTVGVDKIHLSGFNGLSPEFAMFLISDTDEGAVFRAQGTSILIYGVGADELSSSDFVFV